MASVQGWGRLTWGSGAWDEYAPVDATGNGLTSSTEDVTVVAGDLIQLYLKVGNSADDADTDLLGLYVTNGLESSVVLEG